MSTEATKIVTRITLGQFAGAVSDLIENQDIDRDKLRNAVNAALGQMERDAKKEEVKGKLAVVKATKTGAGGFRLSESVLNKFSMEGDSAPLKFYFLNQEVLRLEQTVGTMDFGNWPSYLSSWMKKMKKEKAPDAPKPEVKPEAVP